MMETSKLLATFFHLSGCIHFINSMKWPWDPLQEKSRIMSPPESYKRNTGRIPSPFAICIHRHQRLHWAPWSWTSHRPCRSSCRDPNQLGVMETFGDLPRFFRAILPSFFTLDVEQKQHESR
jgi:hypothetical protein